MIYYINKDDIQNKSGILPWQELKLLGLFDGLIFDDYFYKIGGVMYTEPSCAAQEAFEKEKMWYLLNKTKRTNLEVLKDFSRIAVEIEESKMKARKLRNPASKRLK